MYESKQPDPRSKYTDDQLDRLKHTFLKRMQMDNMEYNLLNDKIQSQNSNHFIDYTSGEGGVRDNGDRDLPIYTPEDNYVWTQARHIETDPYLTLDSKTLDIAKQKFQDRMHLNAYEFDALNEDLPKGNFIDYLSDAGGQLSDGRHEIPIQNQQGEKFMVQTTGNQAMNLDRMNAFQLDTDETSEDSNLFGNGLADLQSKPNFKL